MGLGYNLYHGISECGAEDEDVVCIVDADDFLDTRAFSVVNKAYKDEKCLVTYGSYIKMSKGRKTVVSKKYKTWTDVRKNTWHGSHLKTFKFKLWKYFPKEYMMHDGVWAEAASDRALMYGLIELAGYERCKHIKDPIYFWNDTASHKTDSKLQEKWDKIMRKKEPLKRILTI